MVDNLAKVFLPRRRGDDFDDPPARSLAAGENAGVAVHLEAGQAVSWTRRLQMPQRSSSVAYSIASLQQGWAFGRPAPNPSL